jgi:hypothetical protein
MEEANVDIFVDITMIESETGDVENDPLGYGKCPVRHGMKYSEVEYCTIE